MNLGIQGKVALVTASSDGMGKNIAGALAAEGVDVVLFARTAEKLRQVAHDIEQKHGVKALPVAGNMLASADVDRLAAEIGREFGGLDILILNTGRPPIPLRDAIDELDEARWHDAYRTQLWGTINVAKTLVPSMLPRKWGRVIAVTSASVKEPMSHHCLSTVFRAGITAYMKHLANEVGAHGMTVNCVAPALIATPHRTGTAAYTPAQTEARSKMTPLGRMGTPEEICGTVSFLASMQAGFITGSTINVEGGMLRALV
jgi:3-oxoacyl-[acyl-carrier protein] reductase